MFKVLHWSRRKKCIVVGLVCMMILGLLVSAPVLLFRNLCMTAKPMDQVGQTAVSEIQQAYKGYARNEDQTYLTVPEWYIVYHTDEYAQFLKNNPPSHFPYFSSVHQYWSSYCTVTLQSDEQYAWNSEYHTTLWVIGTSFTAEQFAKGVYENTIGRASELLASNTTTQEDEYAKRIAQEYGTFLHTVPWYKFPFRETLKNLWSETDLWGNNVLRKWERKYVLSIEYVTKSGLAWLIRLQVPDAYTAAAPRIEPDIVATAQDQYIYATVTGLTADIVAQYPDVLIVQTIDDVHTVVLLPRFELFTQRVPDLTTAGVQFIDIAGNDEIIITITHPAEQVVQITDTKQLFAMDILAYPGKKRTVLRVPVRELHAIIAILQQEGITLEHIYDY